jgi:hypothetical protein
MQFKNAKKLELKFLLETNTNLSQEETRVIH